MIHFPLHIVVLNSAKGSHESQLIFVWIFPYKWFIDSLNCSHQSMPQILIYIMHLSDKFFFLCCTAPLPQNNSLPFNKYAYLTTHNAFAIDGEPSHTGVPRITITNQEDTVTQQLNVILLIFIFHEAVVWTPTRMTKLSSKTMICRTAFERWCWTLTTLKMTSGCAIPPVGNATISLHL